jgi:hypothetical protein
MSAHARARTHTCHIHTFQTTLAISFLTHQCLDPLARAFAALQAFIGLGNLAAVILISMPNLLPPDWLPDWIKGPYVIFLTGAMTACAAIVALVEPVASFFSGFGPAIKKAFEYCGCLAMMGPIMSLLKALRVSMWARFQRIFFTRSKKAMKAELEREHEEARREKEAAGAEENGCFINSLYSVPQQQQGTIAAEDRTDQHGAREAFQHVITHVDSQLVHWSQSFLDQRQRAAVWLQEDININRHHEA